VARLHDRRPTDVPDLPADGLPVTLVWIKRDESMRVSHERIDTWLFVQTRAVLDPELTARLRTRRVRRRPRRRLTAAASKHILAMTSIRERPVEALYRRQPAHRRVICSSAALAAGIWSPWSSGTAVT
jgi:hypothetical protein